MKIGLDGFELCELGEVICVVMNEYCFGYGDKAVLRGMNDERDGL